MIGRSVQSCRTQITHHRPVSETVRLKFEIVRKRTTVSLAALSQLALGKKDILMTILSTTITSADSSKTRAKFDSLVSVALFSGVGLLLSISVLLLDKYIPGEWF